MSSFVGYVILDDTLTLDFLVAPSDAPADLDALPAVRVYGPDGLMANGTSTAALAESGSVNDASNTTPIVISSAGHGLSTGMKVKVASVTGNTGANGTWIITVVDANTFSLATSVGNGAFAGGGTWHTVGLYSLDVAALAADGYEAGSTYFVLIAGLLSSAAWGKLFSFSVG